ARPELLRSDMTSTMPSNMKIASVASTTKSWKNQYSDRGARPPMTAYLRKQVETAAMNPMSFAPYAPAPHCSLFRQRRQKRLRRSGIALLGAGDEIDEHIGLGRGL